MLKTSVKVLQGVVKGCVEKLPNGKNYFRFSGIPYAQSPTGQLRFKSPQKLLEFETLELDCTKERGFCFHKNNWTNEYVGSEDCLHLNIYVPDTSTKSKAVMVWIHGGGFATGNSSTDSYSPEFLLMEDVIVVTINYRLHVLGFLSLPSMGISGNAGLKDQQIALEWIYENISNFDGNPENICLFGESAGASSVHFQVLSSKSRKYIKSAICQSGNAICDWAIQRDPVEKTRTLAKLLGCNSENDRDIYSTLMAAPLEDLHKFSFKSGTADERRRNLNFVFKPSIENDTEDAFMSKSPIELMKTEDIDIPIIFGTNDKDGMIQTAYMMKYFYSFDKDPVRMIPISLNIDPNSDAAVELGNQIKEFYFNDDGVVLERVDDFNDLMTDIHFLTSQVAASELHARYQHHSKQYLYEFRYDGDLNMMKIAMQMDKYKGACHADDIFYLFGRRRYNIEIDPDSPAIKMRSLMCKLWTNFAKYHDPTAKTDSQLDVQWKPTEYYEKNAENINLDYFIIDDKFKMEQNVNKSRMDFWRSVYKTWNRDFLKPKL